jgi:hypothetical protein
MTFNGDMVFLDQENLIFYNEKINLSFIFFLIIYFWYLLRIPLPPPHPFWLHNWRGFTTVFSRKEYIIRLLYRLLLDVAIAIKQFK